MKRAKIGIAVILIICCCLQISAPLFTVAGETPASAVEEKGNWTEFAGLKFANADDFKEMSGDYKLLIENNFLQLHVNKELNIAVFDKKQNVWHYSCPPEIDNDAIAGKSKKDTVKSIMYLQYLNENAEMKNMNSINDSIYPDHAETPQYTVSVDVSANKVRFDLLFGKEEQRTLIPDALPAERFEWVIGNLPENQQKIMKRLYTKWSINDEGLSDATMNNRKELYPIYEKMDIYVKKETQNKENNQITTAMTEAGYTIEMKDEDLKTLGKKAGANTSAYFKVPVELGLDGNQFVATVKAGEIEYPSDVFKLLDIRLLPFFGAGKSGEDGYMLLPDGSGMLIGFNNDKTKIENVYSKSLYRDASYWDLPEYAKSISAPVFGVKTGNKSVFAVIEEGDANATLFAEVGNVDSSYNSVYSQFAYSHCELFYFDENTSASAEGWFIADKNVYKGSFTTRYFFLYGGETGYNDMAKCYREYLIGKQLLSKKTAETPQVYIDLLGACSGTEYFLVFPHEVSVPLTKFDQAVSMIEELKNAGVSNLVVRYLGWANGGLENKAFDSLKYQKELGGEEEFKKLAEYLAGAGIPFYPDVAPMTTYDSGGMFSGYSTSTDSPRRLDNQLYGMNKMNMAMNWPMRNWGRQYLIKPSRLEYFFDKFSADYAEAGVKTLSMNHIGEIIYGDYDKKNASNLDESKKHIEAMLKKASGQYSLMLEYGNAYAVPYAERLVNVPLESSQMFIEDATVPFIQMVYHGYLSYAGESLNIGQDIDEYFLRTIEYGADLHFTIAKSNLERIKNSVFNKYPSVGFDAWKERIVSYSESHSAALSKVQGETMVNHEVVAPDVNRVTYSNGTRVYVNYNDADVTTDDGVVKAKNWLVAG